MRLRLVPVCVLCLCATLAYGQEPEKKEEPAQRPAARGVSQRESPSRFSRGSAEAQPDNSRFGRMFPVARPQWEYAVRTNADLGDLDAGLNKLGQEGWELVSVVAGSTAGSPRTTYLFKRAKGVAPFPGFGGVGSRTGGAMPSGGGVGTTASVSSTSGESRGGARTERGAPSAAERTLVLPLRHAIASSLAKTLSQLYRNALTGRAEGPRVATDERTNTLIVVGSDKEVAALVDLIQQLDVAAPQKGEKKR